MGRETGISWTDSTWNPIRGCSRVSEGCRNCYAESVAYRFSGPGLAYEGLIQIGPNGRRTRTWNGQIKFVEKHLLDPLKWKEPRRIFVNSMSDLFHENVTDEMRDQIFAVMALCPQHTFQVLTKRPGRMLEYLTKKRPRGMSSEACDLTPWYVWRAVNVLQVGLNTETRCPIGWDLEDEERATPSAFLGWPLPNVHLGVSVEDQKTADLRIPILLQTPAAVRFISAEPLLGPVSLEELPSHSGIGRYLDCLSNAGCAEADISTKLDWVIVGGESGPGARPMHPDWARGLRDQCKAAGVPFFFKQWGEWTPGENVDRDSGSVQTAVWFDGRWSFDSESLANDEGHVDDEPDLYRLGTKAAGCLIDGVEHHEFPKSVD